MKTAQQILFPQVVLKLRVGFRVKTVVLRPFTLRQIELTKLGLADVLELSTGLTRKELRKLQPSAIGELKDRINMINAWSPADLAKQLEQENPSETKATSLEDLAAELIDAGHDAQGIWDFTPEQFAFYLREARRARTRRELVMEKAFTKAACAGVATLSNEGGKHASELIKALERGIKELGPKS